MTPDPKPTEALKPAPIPKSVNLRGFDHVHWSRLNDEPLDGRMGRCCGDYGDEEGMVVLMGRSASGYHHRLFGPITPKQYRALKKSK